ncbi:MAG: Ig-like domain-containing protein [Candidatus Eiseniibacteriota bacterium]|jgi:hypothetical protein
MNHRDQVSSQPASHLAPTGGWHRGAAARWSPALVSLAVGTMILACDGGGGPNTRPTFRAVHVEPLAGSINRGCGNGVVCRDTIRVTFNRAIDTTAVFDDEAPRYFLGSIAGTGAALDLAGTTVSNEMRTLVIPFQFLTNTDYVFTLDMAQDTDGNLLETTASTSFRTGACTDPCP